MRCCSQSLSNKTTLEPDGEATGCNPVQVGSTPTSVLASQLPARTTSLLGSETCLSLHLVGWSSNTTDCRFGVHEFCGRKTLRVRIPSAAQRSLWWNWKTRRNFSGHSFVNCFHQTQTTRLRRLPVRSTWRERVARRRGRGFKSRLRVTTRK